MMGVIRNAFIERDECNLQDVVSVEELMETLGVMEREESLKRGTSLWSTVVTWLLTTAADPVFPAWTWQGLSATLHTLIDAYLSVSVGESSLCIHYLNLSL